MGNAIRVFVLADHEIVRRGVADVLAAGPGIAVVGQAPDLTGALARVPVLHPDVVVLGVRHHDDGVAICRELRAVAPDVQVILLSSDDDEQAVADALSAGASGYLLAQVSARDLVTAVRTVAAGGSWIDPAVAARVVADGEYRTEYAGPLDALNDREFALLQLLGEGLTNRQIGERMHLAEKTIKNHVSHLLGKLGLQRRTQAAILVTRLQTGQPVPVRPS